MNLTPLFLFLAATGYCQKLGDVSDTIFVDEFFNPTIKANAEYYGIKELTSKTKHSWIAIQNTYYLNGAIQSICTTRVDFNNPKKSAPYKIGIARTYYSNGTLKCEDSYSEGKLVEYASYYENGQLKSKGRVEDFDKIYLYEYFDSSGIAHLSNGNGTVCVYDSSLKCLSYKEVKDSLILTSYHIDAVYNDTIYDLIETKLEPKQGWARFYEQMAEPPAGYKKIKKHIGKTLRIEFIVFDNGKIGRTRALNSLSPEIDNAFIERIKSIAVFNEPKLKSGKPVKVRYVLPIRIG